MSPLRRPREAKRGMTMTAAVPGGSLRKPKARLVRPFVAE